MEILEIPELPLQIKQAAEIGELVIFIGAGMSYNLGCKSWNELAIELIKVCESIENRLLLNHIESTQLKDMLRHSGNNKKIITICEKLLSENGQEDIFLETIKKALNHDNIGKIDGKLKSYKNLFKLNGIFVTTNADGHINELFDNKNIIKENFTGDLKLENRNLYKIHGCIEKQDSLIFTVEQYFKAYGSKEFTRFLNKLFSKTVLFVGYGLGEFELLEYMFRNIDTSKKRFFYLTGYFTSEKSLCSFEQLYFNQLGIQLIPFSKDRIGNIQLDYILEDWVEQMLNTTNVLQANFAYIDEALRIPNKKNISKVIQKMKNDENYKKYFFSQVEKYKNIYLWLIPLKDSNFLSNKVDFKVVNYLKELSIQNQTNYKQNVEIELKKIVDEYFRNIDDTKEHINSDYIEIIFNFKKKNIDISYLNIIDTLLRKKERSLIIATTIDNALAILLKHKMKEHLYKLLETIFSYKNIQEYGETKRYSILEDYYFEEILKNRFNEILSIVDKYIFLEILLKILKSIILKDEKSFNIFSIRTIEEHTQKSLSDKYDRLLITSIRNLLISMNKTTLSTTLKDFISEKHQIFQRLAIYVMDRRYSEFKVIFWINFNNISEKINYGIKYEFYRLLTNNSTKFTSKQIDTVLSWIETITSSIKSNNNSEEESEKFNIHKRKEWLLPLKEHNKKAKKLYEEYHTIVPSEYEYPGLDFYISDFKIIGEDSDEKEQERFCKQSIDDIILELNNLIVERRDKDFNSLLLTKAKDFSNCARTNPKKIVDEIDKFKNIDDMFKYYMLLALNDALKAKKDFEHEMLFDFLLELLGNGVQIKNKNYSLLFWGEVANLLRNNIDAIDISLLNKAKEIVLKLLDFKEDEILEKETDLLTHTLNSYNGKVLHSLIYYLLRYAKINSTKNIKWEDDIKEFFTKELDNKNEYSKNIFTILGLYLPKLSFVDKDWVENNFTKIFPKENINFLKISLGNFFIERNIYLSYYDILKNNGYFDLVFSEIELMKIFNRNSVEYIVYGYLNNQDKEKIIEIINYKNIEIIKEIINVFTNIYNQKEYEDIENEILKLWLIIYNIFKDMEDSNEVFIALLSWIKALKTINIETKDTIIRGVTNASHFTLYKIIDEFLRLSEDNPSEISKIILEISEKGVFFDSTLANKFLSLLKILKNYQPEDTLKIQNLYRKKEYYFVNSI